VGPVLTVFVQAHTRTEVTDHVDPSWLDPDNGVVFWADLAQPTPEEARLLGTVFGFHELAIEDALSETHLPKIESYPGYLYLVVHGIDFQRSQHRFATHDIDFFVGQNYLVTVHDGQSRSIRRVAEICPKSHHLLQEGPAALLHRIVDAMVDNYRPEVDELDDWLAEIEQEVFDHPANLEVRDLLELKRDVASLRRVTIPQRDVVGRLARREFTEIDQTVAFRFRDVHDHLVRIADEAILFQDRLTGLLDAHLSATSNRLNEVMKVLTLITVFFAPLTVLTSLYGMNVSLPHLPGGDQNQFWWIVGMMAVLVGGMLWFMRSRRWL
jgi:magnesium transporter